MVSIPFPLSTTPGASFQESAGRLINCYAEPLGQVIQADRKTPVPKAVWRKSPGLSLFAASSKTGFRGSLLVGNTLYAAWNNSASTFGAGGTETSLIGTLIGTEKVFWARNNKATPDVVCVAPETGGFIVTGSITSWSAVGVPNSVSFMDGYFLLTYGDGSIQASGLNATTINTLDKTTAQSKPGGLSRGVPFNGQFYALGPNFGEVYTNTGNAVGFPFTRSYVLQRGLLGRYAIAGYEDGFGSALIWVADDNSVVMGNGSPNPTKISPPDLDRLIAAVTDKTTLEASVYISGGHPKWVLTSPTFTWEFDLGSQKWNERASYLQRRWRAIGGTFAFGKWLVGDTKGGRLLSIDNTNFTEFGDPLIFHIESGPVQSFPNRTKVARADFNFITGVGIATGPDPIATQPQVMISWSDDLGVTWSQEFQRQLGRQSEADARVTMLRSGQAGAIGRRWRLRVSDPVYVALISGSQDMELRNR